MNKKIFSGFLFLFTVFMLTGCGNSEKKELQQYNEQMSMYFRELTDCNTRIENINPETEDASEVLLEAIDRMSIICTKINESSVPPRFEAVKEHTSALVSDMEQANDAFHIAFESETFNEDSYNKGMEFYESANRSLQKVLEIFHTEN